MSALTDNAKREIQQYAVQMSQQLAGAIMARMENDSPAGRQTTESFVERRQRRWFIAVEMAKVIRARADGPSSIPDEDDVEAQKASKRLMSIAMLDAENLLAALEILESADQKRYNVEMQKQQREADEAARNNATRIVPAHPGDVRRQ